MTCSLLYPIKCYQISSVETQFSELEAKKAELAQQLKSLVAELEMKRKKELEAQLAEKERKVGKPISEARENENTGPGQNLIQFINWILFQWLNSPLSQIPWNLAKGAG